MYHIFRVRYLQRIISKFLVLPSQGVKPVCDDFPGGHNVSFPVKKTMFDFHSMSLSVGYF